MTHVLRRRWPIPAVLCLVLGAAALPPAGADDAPAGRQYALLVGVKNYNKDELRSLKYTENDVSDLAQVLRDAGYKRVVLMTQSEAAAQGDNDLLPNSDNIRRQLKAILDDRKAGDTVLIAFSGHGVQFRGEKASYFCPMDARLGEVKTLVSLGDVYRALDGCAADTKVLFVDACRDDPQANASKGRDEVRLDSVTRPQAERPPGGVAALFSCTEGQRSYESDKLQHGVFFYFVVEGLKGDAANKKGEVGLEGLSQYVKDEVPDAVKDVSTDARQRPQSVGDLSGAPPLVRVDRGVVVNGLGMKLKLIQPGKFLMGSPNDEAGRFGSEGPQHEVEITRPFYLGVYPVTKGQFAAFVKDEVYQTEAEADGRGGRGYSAEKRIVNLAAAVDPKYSWKNTGWEQTDAHPVVNVTWKDAQKFCAWLSRKEGKTYELPTEAEWEYACRAGTTTRFWCGDADASLKGAANVADASLKSKLDADVFKSSTFQPWDDGFPFTSPVGSFQANPWGLYDMHGNVWQLCADRYGPYPEGLVKDPKGPDTGDDHVMRGGSWYNSPRMCRAANRGSGDRSAIIGFRVVLRPAPGTP